MKRFLFTAIFTSMSFINVMTADIIPYSYSEGRVNTFTIGFFLVK